MFSFALLLLLVLVFVVAGILQWLWNITIPDIFGIRVIRYWEAFRLMIICGILFSGTGATFINQ